MADYHHSVWRFVSDFFDNTFCWDNKLLRTLGPLLGQPGFLTLEFLNGHRVRYVHPLRLFLFTSAVCLTLLQFNYSRAVTERTHREKMADHDLPSILSAKSESPSTPAQPVATAKAGQPGPANPDTLADQVGQAVKDQVARNGGLIKSKKVISDYVQRRLSWMALVFLPVFALGLHAMYWRQDAFYFGHLVFSLHYHTFLLLFWTAYTASGFVVAHLPLHSFSELGLKLSLLLPILYLFLALRRLYGESRSRAFAKAFVLGFTHLFTIFVALTVLGGIAFFTQN